MSSEPNETNREDDLNYSHAIVRRLSAEQMFDCQAQVTGVASKFQGYPAGMRATELPGARPERTRGRRSSTPGSDQFLIVFGKPPRLLTCECERSTESTMSQAFQMISGPTVNASLTEPDNRVGRLLTSGKSDLELVDELYWVALTRGPSAAELESTLKYLTSAKDRRLALKDLMWALLNAKEFAFEKICKPKTDHSPVLDFTRRAIPAATC